MQKISRQPSYYLLCGACFIALAAAALNEQPSGPTILAIIACIALTFRSIYLAILSTLFGRDENDPS